MCINFTDSNKVGAKDPFSAYHQILLSEED